jgi:hypothetical protein
MDYKKYIELVIDSRGFCISSYKKQFPVLERKFQERTTDNKEQSDLIKKIIPEYLKMDLKCSEKMEKINETKCLEETYTEKINKLYLEEMKKINKIKCPNEIIVNNRKYTKESDIREKFMRQIIYKQEFKLFK